MHVHLGLGDQLEREAAGRLELGESGMAAFEIGIVERSHWLRLDAADCYLLPSPIAHVRANCATGRPFSESDTFVGF